MKIKLIYFIISILLAQLLPSEAKAILLNLDRVLKSDEEYIRQVKPLFKELKELQIGGTHNHGNATLKKTTEEGKKISGELDPTILNINPSFIAHRMDDLSVLSILGSGFDLALINKLLQVCALFNHYFDKVYINNVALILPIPDNLPADLSRPQQNFFEGKLVLRSGLENSLQHYLNFYDRGQKSQKLYTLYYELLKPNGTFLFKSASLRYLDVAFLTSFLDTRVAFCADLENFRKFDQCHSQEDQKGVQKYLSLKREEDRALLENIRTTLNGVGSKYYFDPKSAESQTFMKAPSRQDKIHSRSNIQMQVHLLRESGFSQILVGFRRLKDWGFYSLRGQRKFVKEGVYSLIIQGTKEAEDDQHPGGYHPECIQM